MAERLLEVNDLATYFFTADGVVKAVDGITYHIDEGESVAIVGESGCGKSVSALSVMRLIASPPGRIVHGEVIFEGKDILKLTEPEMRNVRGNDISMVFQEPMTSLNPVLTIGYQLTEALKLHMELTHKEALERAGSLLEQVGIPDAHRRLKDYPHQFSGGMRQRVMIALAVSCNPRMIIADEPTTALDVTIQAQVINLMKDIIKEYNMGVIFITHDLGVIAQVADDVAVMYLGSVVEQGPVNEILKNPMHPYTKGLINALPDINNLDAPLQPIPGNIPSPLDRPSGCVFRTRCPHASTDGKEGNIEMGLSLIHI